ncbi:MAG: FAD-dependent oxidoreductase, partial [Hydrogenophaga sp.]|nr:FAD-dependent oxidoreductase [Hydrogenophaga sp.]
GQAFMVISAINTPFVDDFDGYLFPGAPLDVAPVLVSGEDAWLLDQLGNRFQLLAFADSVDQLDPVVRAQAAALAGGAIPVEVVLVTAHAGESVGLKTLHDRDGLMAQRMDARPGTCYLMRPDQHVAARWRRFDVAAVRAALARATAQTTPETVAA